MINARLALRPLRLGFLVKHGDLAGLWKAVRYNTCLWGGRFNPIIPVREADLLESGHRNVAEAPLADYLVRAFDVDLLQPVSDDRTVSAFAQVRAHLCWPVGEQIRLDDGTVDARLAVLDVRPVVRELLAGASRDSQWAVPSGPLEGWRAHLMRIMCGDPDGTELGATPLRSVYSRLGPSAVACHEGVPLDLRLVVAWWPIHLSAVGLKLFTPRHGWGNPGVLVGDANSFDDLVAFWNLRAAGNDVMFYPTQAMIDAKPLMQAHLERLGRHKDDPWNGPAIWFVAADDPRRRRDMPIVEEAKEHLGLRRAQPLSSSTWNGLNIRPARVAREWESVIGHLRATYATSAWLDAQAPTLAFDRSLLEQSNRWQLVGLDVIGPDLESEAGRLTLSLPPLPRMNELLDQGYAGARVKKEHVSLFVRAETSVFALRPVAFSVVMGELLEECGFRMRDSVPGKFLRRILELMGGVEGCRVLKMPGVRKLLRTKAARSGIEAKPAREIICDRDPETGRNSFSELGLFLDGERANPAVALRHLVEKGTLRPGIALRCPKCGERTWYAITRLRARLACGCCGAISGTEARIGDRVQIQYRIAPLWRKADVQYGVVPVILALWRLEEQQRLGSGRYVTSVELSGHGIDMEVDFLGLVEERDQRPMLIVGECKSTHERRKKSLQATLAKLRTWYDAVEDSGDMAACVAFITMAKTFDTDLLEECKVLVSEGRNVLLMTARELDPYHAYAAADDVPRRHPIWMRDLLMNGVARYLPEVWKSQQQGIVRPNYRVVRTGGARPPEMSNES